MCIVNYGSAEDPIFGEIRVPTIEAEVLRLRLAQPLCPDQGVLRLRHLRLFVGVVYVDGVVHCGHDHRIEGTLSINLQTRHIEWLRNDLPVGEERPELAELLVDVRDGELCLP